MASASERIDQPSYTAAPPATSWRQRAQTVFALTAILVSDLALRTGGFAVVRRVLQRLRRSSPGPSNPAVVRDLQQAVDRACVYYVVPVMCLTRAVATICVLRSAGITAELVTGVQRLPFRAHAWVEVDG